MKNFRSILRYIGKTSKFIDYPLLVTYIVLSLIGLVMVYSASMVPATKGTLTGGIDVPGTYFYNRQLAYIIMSFIIVFFIAFLMNVKLLSNIKVQKGMIITIVSLLLLTLVIGKDINGSKSWINLGFMNLQGSELLKIAIILYIPFMISKKMPGVLSKPKLILSPIVLALGCTFLVFLQKDVGNITNINYFSCDHFLFRNWGKQSPKIWYTSSARILSSICHCINGWLVTKLFNCQI